MMADPLPSITPYARPGMQPSPQLPSLFRPQQPYPQLFPQQISPLSSPYSSAPYAAAAYMPTYAVQPQQQPQHPHMQQHQHQHQQQQQPQQQPQYQPQQQQQQQQHLPPLRLHLQSPVGPQPAPVLVDGYYRQPYPHSPPPPPAPQQAPSQVAAAQVAATLADVTAHKPQKEVKRRTKTGCLTCRKRRIKCDERHPMCFNCAKSKRVCLGYDPVFKAQRGQNSPVSHIGASRKREPQLLPHHLPEQSRHIINSTPPSVADPAIHNDRGSDRSEVKRIKIDSLLSE
ncbi:hypothetical protein BZA70DRAFT_276309 [Myxozyma melibiosi]|uniref:Zn(2)-C6 fungal-type domain-containing protein n=1 Tax=Myxozyma melibiosi TaxID=54550 RepID=A0ABR1F8Z1_9ASCO